MEEVNERVVINETVMCDDLIENMRLLELREELKSRKLKSTGSKTELQNRLRAAIALDAEREENEDDQNEDDDRSVEREVVAVPKKSGEQGLNLTFRDVEESLSTFSGDDERNILKWLRDFEETSDMCEWSDKHKVIYCKRLLRGSAKLFVSYEKCARSWAELKAQLKEEFAPQVNSRQVHRELARRKKLPSESYQEYMYKMLDLASQIEIDIESVLEYIISGIPDDEVNKTILYGAKNIREFRQRLTLYENMKRKSAKEFVRPRVNERDKASTVKYAEHSNVDKDINDKRCFNCGERGHLVNNCPSKEKGAKCFLCRDFGHVASKCPKKTDKRECNISEQEGNKSYKDVRINNKKLTSLIDTGSDLSLIQASEYVKIGAPKMTYGEMIVTGIGGIESTTLGGFRADVRIDEDVYPVDFHVVTDRTLRHSVLLGNNFLNKVNIQLNEGKVSILKPKKNEGEDRLEILQIDCVQSAADETDLSHIKNPEDREKVEGLMKSYSPCKIKDADVKLTTTLTDNEPVYERARRLSITEQVTVNEHISEGLKNGIIQPSLSDYASPVLLVKKKKEEKNKKKKNKNKEEENKKKKEKKKKKKEKEKDQEKEKIVRNCVICILSERKNGRQEGLLNVIEKERKPWVENIFDCCHLRTDECQDGRV